MLLLAACTGAPDKPPAAASIESTAGDTHGDADVQLVVKAAQMIRDGQIMAAIDGPLDTVVAKYEAAYARADEIVYSARGPSDALLYSAMVAPRQPKKVLVLGPAWAMAYWARGFAYNEMARYDDAIAELQKALRRAPMDSQYNIEIGFAYQGKHQWDESLAHYQAAQAYAPITAADVPDTTCKALRGQGFALTEMHRFDEAGAAYRACLKLIPDEPRSLAELKYIEQQARRTAPGKAGEAGSPRP
ncbi:tetratricopeptide repeat protein [Frateuria sp. GZRe12]|uniref:tetratricopeptide repeat protein n=1 Tax=Frateuria sp. GZRe12 TaxID=3351533 RepID=UPI003EDC9CFE